MVISNDQGSALQEAASWSRRLRRVRIVVPVAAAFFLLVGYLGELSPLQALVGFWVISAAALIEASAQTPDDFASRSREDTRAHPGDLVIDAVISGMPDPVIVLERDGIVGAFNIKALEIAPALTRGQPLSFALRNPGVLEAFRRAATAGAGLRVEFFQRVPADRWSEAVISPIMTETAAGDRSLLVMVFHDMTPLRQIEQMRADFVANASHELRTPLASLSGFIDTLQGPARSDPAARERFLGIMKDQADRMARLIDDLLSLSRIELKAHIHPENAIDLVSLVRQVADALQLLARDRGVTIEADLPEGELMVPGDRDELIRVFENLIENALKYGASGERVAIALAREAAVDGEEAVVSVKDYGPGIAPEHLPRLTERFYRVDVTDSRAQGGTGLGLALVKHILQRHRGRLSIESTLGSGATFAVRLPIVTKARAERNPLVLTNH
jgi:two-component system, OmpR family, phosphate regulon sensor histidine kinase PhoR